MQSASCNGWVAEIDMTGLNTGGTYNFGLGANNNPSTAKIVFTVTSPGFDASGNATTITRTIYGTDWVRQPYPNPTLADESSAGGTTTVKVSLSDFIYSGDTNITATIASGFYASSTPNNAVSNIAVTNNSTLGYPKTIANWSYPGWTKLTGSSFTVRAVAFNRSAQQGLPVKVVKFTATDQHSHTVSTLVTLPTIDNSLGDASKIVEYIGTLPTTSFTAKDLITINFKAYPWVGDASSTMDTSDGVNSQPTPLYAPIYGVYDDGTYGTAAAVVATSGATPAGNDSTCVAVAESAFNSTSDAATAAPCLTINGAAKVINTYNNAHSSRNDAAGTIYVQAGNYNWTGASAAISATASNAWNIITPFPGVSRSSVVITDQSGGKALGGTKIKFENITINIATSPVSVFDGITYLWFDNSSITTNGTAPIYNVQDWYVTDSTVNAIANGLGCFSTTNCAPALIRGNSIAGNTGGRIYTVIGNTHSSLGTMGWLTTSVGSTAPESTAPILAYNTFYKISITTNYALSFFGSVSNPLGTAVVQNLLEFNATPTNPLVWIAADSSTNSPVNNVMLWYNTLVGQRINRAYNSTGSSAVVRTNWSEIGELRDQEDIKSDTFPSDGGSNGARTGNWSVLYGVGRRGVYDNETVGVGAAGGFQMEFSGVNGYTPTINHGTQGQPGSGTNSTSTIKYVNRQAFDGVIANSGGGNYNLQSSSPALNMIPANQAVLPYDIAGNARNNDGTGAAGAYEYVPPVTVPTLTIQTASPVSTSTATLNGTITSNNNASSTIEGFNYGTTLAYGSVASSTGTFGTGSFLQVISGLTASTTYHFQAFAINSAGTGTSTDLTFTTSALPAPNITSIASSTTQTSATITWTTDQNASSTVNYGSSISYGTASTSANLVTSHSITLSGLSAFTTYHFQVGGANSAGTISTSSDLTFKTTDTTPPAVTVTVPTTGTTVHGSSVTLTATSTDNVAVAGVQFKFDTNTLIGAEGATSPYSVTWDTTSGVADGAHTIIAVARDSAGNYATSTAINITVDNTAPVRSVGVPSGTLALNTTNSTLSLLTNETATCKYSTSPDTAYGSMSSFTNTASTTHSTAISGLSNGGNYNYYVKCQDNYSNTNATDYTISFSVASDITAPGVTMTAPTTGTTVHGSSVTLTATSTDDVGVVGVQFKLDNATNVGAEGATSPYSVTWDTTAGIADGPHSIVAVARDGNGNYATSTATNITVDNTAPVRSLGAPTGALSFGTTVTTLSLTTGENATCKYSVSAGTAYGSMSAFDTTGTTTHSTAISGLTNATSYTYYVRCQDNYTNTNATDYNISFSVAGDTTPPTVSVTAPADAATVSGLTVIISADASDNVAVAGVQFKLDTNTLIDSEVTTLPYSITWDSNGVADGSHTIIAVARDNSGNYATSTAINITVSNTVASVVSTIIVGGASYSHSGSSVQNQVNNLISMGNQQAAEALMKQYPAQFPNQPATAPVTFIHNLSLKSTSSDVRLLQNYLNTHGFIVAKTGDGSLGHETTYFGSATKAALIKFQKVNDILPATGDLGPRTRALLNKGFSITPVSTPTFPSTQPSITNSSTSSFTRDLEKGMKGEDVKLLQVYLNTHGFPVAMSGDGSLGHETTLFGLGTKAALIKFQKANGITPASGYFGPKTQQYISSH